MIFEIIVLAVASTVRPTSLAAVYALLSHGSRRMLWAYVLAGLVFCVGFGVLVVGVFHGVHVHTGNARVKTIADLLGGVVMLLFAVGLATGRIRSREPRPGPRERRLDDRLSNRLTVRTAAIAGPLTHLPGLFYLVALNLIVAHNPLLPGGLVAVLIFVVIWFTLPILALALSMGRPESARELIGSVQEWSGLHAREILLTTATVVGVALIVRGLLTI